MEEDVVVVMEVVMSLVAGDGGACGEGFCVSDVLNLVVPKSFMANDFFKHF